MPISRRDFLNLSLLGLSLSACQKILFTQTLAPSIENLRTDSSPTSYKPELSSETPASTPTIEPTQTSTSTPQNFPAFVIDGHQDIAWNALEFGRDPIQSIFVGRNQEAGGQVMRIVGERTSGFPEWLVGRVGIISATLFVMPAHSAYGNFNTQTYTSPQQAAARANEQLSFYRQLSDNEPQIILIETHADLNIVVDTWMNPKETPIVGLVILMEGADPIIEPADIETWYAAGLRMIGPSWGMTRYAGGTGEPGPLTRLGRELLASMADFNMVLDLSHMARAAFLQAVEIYPGPQIASHSNPRAFLPTDRGLGDDMITLLAERDGVIGIMPYNRYLVPGWERGHPKDLVGLEIVAQAIDYIVQLTGSSRHAAIGSDFDGGFGRESIPFEMDSIADMIQISNALKKWGYDNEDIEAVMYGNWLRILQNCFSA